MNKKGFTVIELMTTFVLVAVISTLLVKLVITLKEIYINGDMKTTLITKQSTMTDKIYKDLKEKDLTKIESCGENVTNCVKFVFTEGTKTLIVDKTEKTLKYDNYTIKLDRSGYFGDVSINKYNSDIGSILHYQVPIYNKLVKGDFGLNITYQIDKNVEFDTDMVFDIKDTGVTVTFDANGGEVSQTTKQVTVGETYGSLPTPTRQGYTFKGWHGKNLVFDSDIINSTNWVPNQNVKVNKKDDYVEIIYDQTWSTPGYILNPSRILEKNKQYTLSYYARGIDTNHLCIGFYSGENGYCTDNLSTTEFKKIQETFTSLNRNQDFILFYYQNPQLNKGFQVKWVQLEEGSTATEYEPYYIESNTKVVQNKDHTLKAIWEAN